MSAFHELEPELQAACARLGLRLPEGACPQLLDFLALLLEANQGLNLTAVTEPRSALHKHLVDSLALLALPGLPTDVGSLWMDLGSGGGLPALPLAICLPAPRFALVEATQKKAAFLEGAARALGLAPRVQALPERAEALGQDPRWRGQADLVSAKALGSLAELCELGLPLLKPGGRLVAFKGPKAEEEIQGAQRALDLCGGVLEKVHPYSLEDGQGTRALVVLRAERPCPKAYPRAAGLPKRRPLA